MISALSKELTEIVSNESIDIDSLRHDASRNLVSLRIGSVDANLGPSGMGGAKPDNPIPLHSADVVSTGSLTSRSRSHRRAAMRIAACAAAVLAVGIWAFFQRSGWVSSYSTGIGEQRSVKLDDGSIMYLNIGSSVSVHFNRTARDVQLQEGEALFVVAHDTARPFRVTTGNALVRAVGTQFNVRVRGGATTVSVIEGKVDVSSATSSVRSRSASPDLPAAASSALAKPIQLVSGDVAHLANGKMEEYHSNDIDGAIAWRQRRLVVRDQPLSDIVAEFNRYNREPQFRIEGDALKEKRYTGTLNVDDPGSLQGLLEQYDALQIERTDREVIIRSK